MHPPLVIAAWEAPSGPSSVRFASPVVRVPAHFQGVDQILLAQTLDFGAGLWSALVRREGDTDEANWTPLRAFDAQMMPWPLFQPWEEWYGEVVKESVYGRIVWSEGAMGVLHPDGRAHWYVPGVCDSQAVPFRWHDGTRDWTPIPAREWKNTLEMELQDPNSDASFAYRWAFLSEEQRRETVWECDGGWENFYNLLQWMMRAQPDLEQEQSYAIRVLCLNYGQDVLGLEFGFDEWINDRYEDKRVEWIVDWENITNRLFSIRRRRDLIECYSCANVEFPLDRAGIFLVERGPTSHHEKLEALLNLNAWASARGTTMITGELPRLDLEAWELEPFATEPREGVATVRMRANWLGEERDFWLRQVKMGPEWFVTFARLCDGSLPGNWVLCGDLEDEGQPGMARSWKRTDLAPLWEENAQYSLVGRLFCLDLSRWRQPGQASFVLCSNGKGYLEWQPSSSGGEYDDHAIFKWDAKELETASSHQWLEQLETELSDTTSDVSFALRWAQLSQEEQEDRLVRCQRGDFAELCQVLEWVICCDPMLAWSTGIPPKYGQRWFWAVWPTEKLVLLPAESERPTSGHLTQWREAILNWFVPALDEELKKAHPCVESFYFHVEERLVQVNVALQRPEKRAEALRQLREWSQGKVPDELLQTLL